MIIFNPNIQFEIPKEQTVIGNGPASPFYADGWLKWNEEIRGLKAERIVYTDGKSDYPRLEGVLYANKKGKVEQPPLNPYLPFRFISSATDKKNKIYSQYLKIMQIFAEDLISRGIAGNIYLPPGFIDVRPFIWQGFETEIRYTFMFDLPYDIDNVDKKIKNKINKAQNCGYRIERTKDWQAVRNCLKYSEEFKNFSHRSDAEMLKLGSDYMGDQGFIGHVVLSKDDEAVAGGVRLLQKNGIGYGLMQGGNRKHLKNGVNQFLYKKILSDIYDAGAKYYDWGGANTPSVAQAKSAWGVPLVPFMKIREKNFRHLALVGKSYLKKKFFSEIKPVL
ncbi:MAG: hypothetical protein CSB55_02165 [Candidatus Cloacimonadota bacterium]|nr:MAG: hypothetical protein CSB55_02165 [Candidatus Cloacimonadota bacterium]